MNPAHWPAHEWKRAKDLLDRGYKPAEIAQIIGRKADSVRDKIRWERMSVAAREERRARINASRRSRAHRGSERRYIAEPAQAKIFEKAPPHVFEERAQRQAVARTPIEELLGEPPRGYSALDRKLRGEEDPFCLDRRAAQVRSRITLAGESRCD